MSPEIIAIPDDLVAAARDGDSDALSRLWDACAPILVVALRRWRADGVGLDPADLAQEAALLFLEMIRTEAPTHPPDSFGRRFAHTLYWRLHDYLRAERRRQGRQVRASEDDLERALRRRAAGAPPSVPGRQITRALERLSPRQRAVVTALYFEDRSVRAVAADLGVSYHSIETARRRAFKVLREALAEGKEVNRNDRPERSPPNQP